MRKASAEAVQKRVLKDAQDGIVLIYSGEPEAELDDVVQNIAGECAARGFQVKVGTADEFRERSRRLTMHGQTGAPFVPMVAFGADMKSQAAGQIEQLRERLAKASSQTAGGTRDPLDVMHCRDGVDDRLAGAQDQGLLDSSSGCRAHKKVGQGLDQQPAEQRWQPGNAWRRLTPGGMELPS